MSIYIGNNVYYSKTKINDHKGCGKNTSPRSIFLFALTNIVWYQVDRTDTKSTLSNEKAQLLMTSNSENPH